MRKTQIAALVAVAAFAMNGCRPQSTPPTTAATGLEVAVAAKGFLFSPDEITIAVGGTVTWSNSDSILHTVTSGTPESPNYEFDRDLEGAGTSTSIRFEESGDYPFFCSRHPHMTGVVHVEDMGS